MHVLLNCFNMPTRREGAGGAGSYIRAILPTLARKVDLCIVTSRLNKREYACKGASTIAVDSLSHPRFSRLLSKADLFYDPQNGLDPRALPSSLPVIVMIHDLQHNHYPHLFGRRRFEERNRDYGFAIARADGVVAISEWEKKNFWKYFRKKEVRVVPHAAYLYETYRQQGRAPGYWQTPDSSDYFLYPAVAWPHKNHYRLIEALDLVNRHRDKPLKLVLTGVVEHVEAQSVWKTKLDQSGEGEHIEVLGFVPDEELIGYMLNVKGVIFPSLYEGFGIPVVDAMQFEKPVIASPLTCIPEVTNETVRFFRDPFDSFKMAQDLEAFDRDVEKGAVDTTRAKESASRYSVDHTVDTLLEFFEDTVRRKKSAAAWSLVTHAITGARVAVQRLTLIVDVESAPMPSSAAHRNFIDGLLAWTNDDEKVQGFAMVLLCPIDAAERLDALVDAKRRDGSLRPRVCLYDRKQPGSRELALRFCLQDLLTTDYFLVTNLAGFLSLDFAAIKNGVAYMDLYADCFSCIFEGEANGGPRIRRPEQELDGVAKAVRSLRQDPLQHFMGRVIRTETCREDQMVGSVECVTKDVNVYSSVIL